MSVTLIHICYMILTFDVKMYWIAIKTNCICFGKYQPKCSQFSFPNHPLCKILSCAMTDCFDDVDHSFENLQAGIPILDFL